MTERIGAVAVMRGLHENCNSNSKLAFGSFQRGECLSGLLVLVLHVLVPWCLLVACVVLLLLLGRIFFSSLVARHVARLANRSHKPVCPRRVAPPCARLGKPEEAMIGRRDSDGISGRWGFRFQLSAKKNNNAPNLPSGAAEASSIR